MRGLFETKLINCAETLGIGLSIIPISWRSERVCAHFVKRNPDSIRHVPLGELSPIMCLWWLARTGQHPVLLPACNDWDAPHAHLKAVVDRIRLMQPEERSSIFSHIPDPWCDEHTAHAALLLSPVAFSRLPEHLHSREVLLAIMERSRLLDVHVEAIAKVASVEDMPDLIGKDMRLLRHIRPDLLGADDLIELFRRSLPDGVTSRQAVEALQGAQSFSRNLSITLFEIPLVQYMLEVDLDYLNAFPATWLKDERVQLIYAQLAVKSLVKSKALTLKGSKSLYGNLLEMFGQLDQMPSEVCQRLMVFLEDKFVENEAHTLDWISSICMELIHGEKLTPHLVTRMLVRYTREMENDPDFLNGREQGCLRAFLLLIVRTLARSYGIEGCAAHLQEPEDWRAMIKLFGLDFTDNAQR